MTSGQRKIRWLLAISEKNLHVSLGLETTGETSFLLLDLLFNKYTHTHTYFVALGFEFMASHFLGRHSYHLSHSTFFCDVVFQDGFRGYLPGAGFEP
jgi:hypothetical protein